jgi:hypothetical protein
MRVRLVHLGKRLGYGAQVIPELPFAHLLRAARLDRDALQSMAKVEDLLGAQLEPLFLCSGILHEPAKGGLVQKDSLMWIHSKPRPCRG